MAGRRLGHSLERSVAAALGAEVRDASPTSGGDIHEAWTLTLVDGRRVFLKSNADAPLDMFEAEAHGLAWLAAVSGLRTPKVLHVGHTFLLLELLTPSKRVPRFDETLGHGLAELHRHGPPLFGLERDNYIGRLPQPNRQGPSWPDFYRELRLGSMVERAAARGLVGSALRHRFDRLFGRLDELVGPAEPPARLHGDLWGGNLHVDAAGEPCLIDPAVYGGHREIDLAMMRLFGGFSERVFDAYHEASPLAPGHSERVALYQLYPLLVHVNLFGRSYVAGVERALDHYVG